jgi:DNA-binding response OmpR family regulator
MANNTAKLVVVEDDLDVAEMLFAYFRIQGYDVNTVNWGDDALAACLNVNPDLVILDIRLPDIDGYEVAQRLRANRRTQDIPIIFLTDKRAREDRLRGLSLGADDYVTKPFDVQELRLRVRNAIQRARQGGLVNPVTGLPEGKVVDEVLAELQNSHGWTALAVQVRNLEAFREQYGFVAADDVLRAISLMVSNTLRDVGASNDFIGHLNQNTLLLITKAGVYPTLKTKIKTRLEQAIDFFYPLKDRLEEKYVKSRLKIRFTAVQAKDTVPSEVSQFKTQLLG